MQAVLRVQLELGQSGIMKSEFDSMQLSLREFYSTSHDGDILILILILILLYNNNNNNSKVISLLLACLQEIFRMGLS